jgi:membrane-associated protease RseP (regulator of RpoE activity)
MYLVLALLLQSGSVQLSPQEASDLIIARATEVERSYHDWQQMIDERFGEGPDQPRVGVFLGSNPAPGEDGLHALMVLGVHADSPAQRAGVRPGDRILRIDERRLEHESVRVAHLILNNAMGPMRLTVLRGDEVLVLTVHRTSLPCLDRAVDLLDLEELRATNAKMCKLLQVIRDELEREPAGPETLDAAQAGVKAAARYLVSVTEKTRDELYRATVTTCHTSFE